MRENNSRVLIASHRGHFGGNIVENTIPAFEAALRSGADIVETDIHITKDQVMILFHDPSPMRLLDLPGRVEDYTLDQLRSRPLKNVIGEPSDSRVNTLDEMLDVLKGRCMINLDQCWSFIDSVYDVLEEKGMTEQALIKGRAPYREVTDWIAGRNYAPQFIPVITCAQEIQEFRMLPKRLKIPIVEVFIQKEEDEVISEKFVEELRQRGIRLWVNSLTLGNGQDMSAGHDDSLSVTKSPDRGWGWLVERGAGVIQTDWPLELRNYLDRLEGQR